VGLGVFGGLGMLFQVDGLAYTSASTSAFLTQCHCLFVPILAALLVRRWPSMTLLFASLLVLVGVAILAELDWAAFRLRRGEAQTLVGALFFSGQILLLDRPAFARNRSENITLVMFITMGLSGLPLALVHMNHPGEVLALFGAPSTLFFMLVLVLLCTVLAFWMMNRWQPFIPASEAALIYAAEPLFATLFALFLPELLSALIRLPYPNEAFTHALLAGGAFILAANFIIQRTPSLPPREVVVYPTVETD
jgi:drug/metabolite transporter (DMT)-like permease